jgi:hypothetical protein
MATTTAPALSLADLEAYDPGATRGAGAHERRFCCPLCGHDKPRDTTHRSLSVNAQSGAWTCYRCGGRGKVVERWTDRPRMTRRELGRERLRQAFTRRRPTPPARTAPAADTWRDHLANLEPLAGTPGAAYLLGRGIPLEVAEAAGAWYAPAWQSRRAAVVFTLTDRSGELVAAQGRYIDACDRPKARTAGPKSQGAFAAPATVNGRTFSPWEAPAVILTEAPLDALSLVAAGYPAVALCGTTGPEWLHLACGLRRVLLALDGDSAGDNAAEALEAALSIYGARCERLRPPAGSKDWNELLIARGADLLRDYLAPSVLF